jgi:hypothetical protein
MHRLSTSILTAVAIAAPCSGTTDTPATATSVTPARGIYPGLFTSVVAPKGREFQRQLGLLEPV